MIEQLDDIDVSIVIDLVAQNIHLIEDCNGKDIAILVGREETGKSTTINALLGTKFQISSKDDFILEPIDSQDIKAPMGSYDKKGLMCTVFPAAYFDQKNNIVFLDTQGFFGTDKIQEYEVASSILLDAAIKSAKTVRVIYLEDFNLFHKGYTGIAESIRLLNRIVKDSKVPIFYLFNKYLPSYNSIQAYYQKDDEQRNEFVCKKLMEDSEIVVSGTKTSYTEKIQYICKKIKKIITKEEIQSSINEYQKFKSACLIEHNFKEGRFGYIDPLSEWSINNLRENIKKLPCIQKNYLSFNYYNENRKNFTKKFEADLINKMIPIINDINFSLKFPPDLIEQLREKALIQVYKNMDLVSLIEDGYEISQDEQRTNEIQEIFNDSKNKIKDLIHDHSAMLETMKNKIQRIIDHEPVINRRYYFDEPHLPFLLWRNHTVIYDDTVPIHSIYENLCPGTVRSKLINFDLSKYDQFNKDGVDIFQIKDHTNADNNFEVSYSSMSTSQKIVATAAISISALTTFLAFKNQLDLPIGFGLSSFLPDCKICKGVILILVRYQDKEKATLENDQKFTKELEEQLEKEKKELKEIEECIKNDKIRLISKHNEDIIKNIEELEDISNFVNDKVSSLKAKDGDESFNNLEEKLNMYYQICNMLYDESDQNESINSFINAYYMMKNSKPENPNITVVDMIDQYKLRNMSHLFPFKYDKKNQEFINTCVECFKPISNNS